MTYYLKYRNQTLEDIDLENVREVLINMVKSGNIPHAILFAGPKGTGKTSAARIMAKIVNCESTSLKLRGPNRLEPCNQCEQCVSITKGTNIDVLEMDAASHRGIDDVRIIRDAVKLSPARAKKKVYIIDEAHMLTTEASNALLKTLEEPPAHVMFILATTNPEKLLATIRSRSTVVYFRKAAQEELIRSLERIVKGEKLKAPKEVLELIARRADGSFRDGAKILDQLAAQGKPLTVELVHKLIFSGGEFQVAAFIGELAEKNAKGALEEIDRAVKKGVSMETFLENLLEKLRGGLLAEVGVGEEKLDGFTKSGLITLIDLFENAAGVTAYSPIEELPVEVAAVKWCESRSGSGGGDESPKTPSGKKTLKVAELSEDTWKKILAEVRPVNSSIEALLRAAKPIGLDGKNLRLGVYYKFHKERLEDGKNSRILEGVVEKILGTSVRIVCTLTEPPPKPKVAPELSEPALTHEEDKDIIEVAEKIFGN